MVEYVQNVQNQRFFETQAFPGCFFVTASRRDLEIGSYERSWRVDVSFGSFGQRRLPESGQIWPKLPKTEVFFRNISLFWLELLNGRSRFVCAFRQFWPN